MRTKVSWSFLKSSCRTGPSWSCNGTWSSFDFDWLYTAPTSDLCFDLQRFMRMSWADIWRVAGGQALDILVYGCSCIVYHFHFKTERTERYETSFDMVWIFQF